MKCKEIHHQINPYLSGLLDDKKRMLFESHLEECVLCKQLINEVNATIISADNEQRLQADPFLSTRLLQEIENRKENRLLAKVQRILQPIAFVALLFIGAYLGIGLGNSFVSESDGIMITESETLVADFLLNDIDYGSIELILLEEKK